MKTDSLIDLLARDTVLPTFRPLRIAALTLLVVALCSAVFLALAGVRPDLGEKLAVPEIMAKAVLPALACLIALRAVLCLSRPASGGDGIARWLGLPALGAGLLWVRAFLDLPAGQRFSEVGVLSLSECIGLITLLAALPAAVLILLLRNGATVRPYQSAFLAGLAAGSGAAAGYSFFCVQDNPLFYVTWYGFAILLVAVVTTVAGGRLLRW